MPVSQSKLAWLTLAWFSDGPGRSRFLSRALSLPRLMDLVQSRVLDVIAACEFCPIRGNVTVLQKWGMRGMWLCISLVNICTFLTSVIIGYSDTKGAMTSRTRLWTKSIRRGRERARDKNRERPGLSENQARLIPNLGILWISVCSFWLWGSIVANPIIYRLVPSPSRYEIRQYSRSHDYERPTIPFESSW